ncbi:hypothetical protein [Leuconostoc lactis]|uniref:hypothetical protein n=1 Tax=Leuconostoc lactis TaxID=1246 RepID=UPI00020DA01E|nr:hypothetical protein [Leuconostoc lactis]KQB80819.1 hypothetical protein AN225_06810 [Leuconostoc lactis]MCT3115376.1 hypothetical protein [Leuconostoc lactis]ORI84829.1 hypothetical protein BMS94_03570 [Leuconostoc lactis]ORI86126.1 hypothetical protein BMS96_07020 [Leuconostoc lactis]QEA47452.1 hypothetical protein FGL80_04295 [Leuconostoc lactis]
MPVPLLQKFLFRILHHPNTVAIVLLSTMVMIMLSYNTIIRFGLSWPIVMTILKVYPLAVLFIYCLRTYVTLPLVLKLHNYFPKHFTTVVPRHVSIPVLVIAGNVSVMMVILTETHRQLYPYFIPGYFGNWAKTFFVAVPVFFFIVRPAIDYLFNNLKVKYPSID